MNKKVILSSILSLILCVSLIAGSTFALFTSESSTNISINSGKVEVVATIDTASLSLYSPSSINKDGTIPEDATNAATTTFVNGGTASFNENATTLTLTNMTPGDKVDFTVNIKNNSNVIIKYRANIKAAGETAADNDLLKALVINVDEKEYNGEYNTIWSTATPGNDPLPMNISVELPGTATDTYQDMTVALAITIEAVQGNTNTDEEETSQAAGTAEDLKNLISEALAGQSGDVTIQLTNNIDVDGQWEAMQLGGYNGVNSITVEGMGFTISNLNAPLMTGTFAGYGVMTFKNLTIENANITADTDNYNKLGIGAFLAYSNASGGVEFNNCHLIGESSITATSTSGEGGYAGGFVGYSDSKVTVKNCSVKGATISGANSSAAIVGMLSADSTVSGCTFENNNIISTDTSWRIGLVVGTINADKTLVITDTTVSGTNTLTMANASAPASLEYPRNLYGRIVEGNTDASTTIKVDTETFTAQ